MKRLLVLAALAAGCSNNVINTPIRVFDRPSDVALTCVQGSKDNFALYQTHPLSDCDPTLRVQNRIPIVANPNPDPVNTTDYIFPVERALVANSARGEVALVDLRAGQIVDLNPENPGFGFLPVGKMPEHVRITADGCQAVTANVDSCDVALIDMARLHNAPQTAALRDAGIDPGTSYTGQLVRRLVPTINNVPVGARPTWIEFAPDAKPGMPGAGMCDLTNARTRAWVAMPGCQLVAELDLDAKSAPNPALGGIPAEVVRAIRVTPSGAQVVTDLSTISCPAECSGGSGTGGAGEPADLSVPAGPTDGGVLLPTTQAGPSTIAIDNENGVSRMVIGDGFGETLYVVPLASQPDATPAVGTPRAVTLEKGANGVKTVRVSPRSQAGKFVYAIARDNSVRVVDLDREAECETNPDPRSPLLRSAPQADPVADARRLGCLPLGDPGTPARNPLFTTPGIMLQNGALPKDVTFVHLDVPTPPTDPSLAPTAANPSMAVGDFAWIVASDGRGVLVNIFDACPQPNLQLNPQGPLFTPACLTAGAAGEQQFIGSVTQALGFAGRPQPLLLERLAHRPRQGNNRIGAAPVNCGDNSGTPRLQDEQTPCTITVNGAAGGSCLGFGAAGSMAGPDGGVSQVPTLVSERFADPSPTATCASAQQRSIAVYDPDHVRNESWDVIWEGLIPGTNRSAATLGKVTEPPPGSNQPPPARFDLPADVLADPGAAWCTRGVKAGDKATLAGCNVDTDCDFTQVCVRSPSAPPEVTNGLCVNKSDKDALTAICDPLLMAVRSYRILHAYQGRPLELSGGATGEASDWLKLGELYEPEHAVDFVSCDPMKGDSDCVNVTEAGPKDTAGLATPLPTRCLPDLDGNHRCIRACDPGAQNVEGVAPIERLCGAGYICASSSFLQSHFAREPGRCMRSPIDDGLFQQCLRELQPYGVQAGDSFIVTGSATGFLSDLQPNPATRECEVPPISSEFVRLRQSRIPIAASVLPMCPALASPLDPLPPMSPNACLISATTDTTRVHFENPFFAFALDLPQGALPPRDGTDLKFTLVGGGFPTAVSLGVDVQAQQPRTVVTDADGQTIFVVDEGKSPSAAGLRGQLLRVSTAAQATDRAFIVR